MILTLDEYVSYLQMYKVIAYLFVIATGLTMIYAWLKKLKADQDVERYKVNPNYTKLGSKLWQRSLKRWEIIYWICFLTVHIAVPYQLYEVGNQTYEIVSTEQTEINGVEVYKVTLKDKILDVNIINYELVKDKEEQ